MGSRRLGVVCAAIAALLFAAVPPATAQESQHHQRVDLSKIVGNLGKAQPKPPVPVRPRQATSATPDCETVNANLADYAKQGVQKVLCVSSTAESSAPQPVPRVGPAATNVWCSPGAPNVWYVTRTELCLHDGYQRFMIIEVPTGVVLGTAVLAIDHEVTLSATNLDIEDSTAITLVSSSGELRSPVATLASRCGTPCGTVDNVGFTRERFTEWGQTHDGFMLYRASPFNRADFFGVTYTLTVETPGAVPPQATGEWSIPSDMFRCDDLVSNFAGCVIPFFKPELQLTTSVHKEAAVGILVGQLELPDGFGRTQPLTRLADDAAAEANRQRICDSTFRPRTDVTDDSCDEYAFAKTRQSGGYLGLSGKDCAEVIPRYDSQTGDFWYEPIRMLGTERCLQAHVPLPMNSRVGGDLGALTNTERLLDNDPYYVGVYAF
ncbi:hypothetical protein KIPE111705_46320 [Kibdelosporangium persicum]|uniref:Uncharacterized protein n=2 Tax=Kibdelosporangium persicum TaxID=2698649 RepID=A0ABX2F328_9PSEU|nr:hypothetical protein [Kibdelosporangium persicum]